MEFKGKYAFLSTIYGSVWVNPIIYEGIDKPQFKLTKAELIKLADPALHPFIRENMPEEIYFTNIETAFQALRCVDEEPFKNIIYKLNGVHAKQYVKENKVKARKGWTAHREGIMRALNYKKFVQNPVLAEKLCLVTETLKYENAYNDYFWGVCDKKGQNMLGQILREVRNAIMDRKIEALKKRLTYLDTKNERDTLIENFSKTYNVKPEDLVVKIEEESKKGGKAITFKNDEQSKLKEFMRELEERGYFFITDTETTGVSPKFADIIELSAIKIDKDFNIVEEFDTFINPGYNLPPEILEFNQEHGTGIDDALLAAAPKPKVAFKAFKEFVGEDPMIVGHNIPFDIRFIDKLYVRQAKQAFEPQYVMDTLKMSKEKVPGKHNLGILYEQIPDAPHLTFHKSIDDIKATLEVFKWLVPMYLNDYKLEANNKLVKFEEKTVSLEDYLR